MFDGDNELNTLGEREGVLFDANMQRSHWYDWTLYQ